MISTPDKKNGFTMIEAVAALVLIGILVAAAVPRLRGLDSGLETEAEILRSHLRYAQSMAMANNVSTWSVNIAGASYSLLKDGGNTQKLPGESSNTHSFRGGVTATAPVLTLDYLGSPGMNDVSITLSDSAGRTAAITMLGNTGFIQ